jgi:calcineurin-like phosphoesterase family protein
VNKFWISADFHAGHARMLEDGFGARPKGYEDRLFKNLQETVGVGDIFINLGDFCFYHEIEWHQRLQQATPAKKWLVLGNHDHKSVNWYLAHGWDFAGENLTLDMHGKKILFSHRPVRSGEWDLNIHGHWHNNDHRKSEFFEDGKHLLVAIENTNYQVVDLRKLVEKFINKK